MIELPQIDGGFPCIVADPPWQFSAGTKGRPQHYQRMRDDEIAAMPVRDIAAADCWLFMWVTSPKIFHMQRIAKAWGFRYSGRAFVWVKLLRLQGDVLFVHRQAFHTGTGYTTRKNVEDVLLFRRGKPQRLSKAVHEVIVAPIAEHSRKPDEFYSRVETFCPGPRLELFARRSRSGWSTWGNQATKFDEVAA